MKIKIYEETWDKLSRSPRVKLKQFYPRRIICPEGYLNPAYYSLNMWACSHTYHLRRKAAPDTSAALLTMANQILTYDMPMYFVDEKFLLACDATSPPKGMTFDDLRWPMPAMVFALPMAYVLNRFKFILPFVGCVRTPGGPIAAHPLMEQMIGHNPEMGTDKPMALLHMPLFCEDGNPVDYCSRYPSRHSLDEIKVGEDKFEDCTEYERSVYNNHKAGLGDMLTRRACDVPTKEQEIELLNEYSLLAVKLILTMTALPHLTSTGGLARERRARNGTVIRDELWHPNFIGRGYQLRTASADGGGTHASPHMHWRKGHWHHVVHGKGRALRKLDWFEPVLVNPPE